MNIVRNHNRLLNVFGKRLHQRCAQSLTTEISIQKPVLEPLLEREVIQVKGEEIVPFLQGLITNDIKHLHPSSSNAIYAMFLNKSGRVMCDVILYSTSEPTKILIECDKNIKNELQRHLKLYTVRRKIDIVSLHDECKVWQAFEPYKQSQDLINAINKGGECDLTVNSDPRLKQLGLRILARSDKKFSDLSRLFKDTPLASNGNNYRLHRYNLGIAEGVGDMPPGKCFPLEANCDILNGVSFHKGCYIGQELTARVHHTGMIRKRHMPIKLSTPIPNGITPVVQDESGRNCGTVYGSISDRALGLLRVENVFKAKELLVNGNQCFTERPQWWPVEIHPNVSKTKLKMPQEAPTSSPSVTFEKESRKTVNDDSLELYSANDKSEIKFMDSADMNRKTLEIEGKSEITQDDERIAKLKFSCNSCGIEEMVHYFGLEPDFVCGIKFNEPTYIMRDPFQPPPPRWKQKPEYFVALGSHCKLCDSVVCKDNACSFFFINSYCLLCAKNEADSFPHDVQQKLRKQLAAT